ncbi:hypothetical protein TD95_001575 [Thielaviopsis punctulata]|uniref:Arf-GAP domain-containing protein n=1 Tax=Thielaviopsis punctulata TaxID=72032 RepID=A0A0F4ZH20_9PEZI|nr:hypothetical protein TD95_001575 [Thielaviopsis punctulata]
MTSKAMWEVDPETRSKLAAMQREPKNSICCDCNAPSPQWASPKFGIFICLVCAGVHRGLGVHISFVRSISMDAFKAGELERMRLGGNAAWQDFFAAHPDTKARGLTWDSASIADRYSGDAGDEWKERLSARVEGREYVPVEKKPRPAPAPSSSATTTPLSGSRDPMPPHQPAANKTRVDDAYFARLGDTNASRPDNLPPSQGGKYAGFGNTPAPSSASASGAALPTITDLQADPVAALTKGFGWFTSTVTKTAKTVNDGYIQPTARTIAESEQWRTAQTAAQTAAQQVARSAAVGARSAQDGFNRFVEGGAAAAGGGMATRGYRQAPIDDSKKDFWDSFSSIAEDRNTPSSIGTAAMGKKNTAPAPAAKKDDEWDW